MLRSFNRFRAFFCFPIHHGELSQTAKSPTIIGHAITAVELGFFYWPIMVLAILFWFTGPSPATQADARAVLGVLFIYAAPFFFTCSQSRYNFPIVPLCAVFAVAFIEGVRERSWQEVMEPLRRSVWRRRALYATLAFFFYIQVEWMWIVVRAADQGRLASLSGPVHHVSWRVPKKRGCAGLDESAREQHTVAMSGACYSLHPARYASRTVPDLKPMLADL